MPSSSQALLGLYILASGLQGTVEVGVVPRLVVAEDAGVMTEESAAVNLATPAMTTERMLMQRIVSK
ncbi:hypothetical protein H633G_11400 [Metarhizium anisopliae BRIP 53284]|nr:hypothetical protein H633G_11400 [Metarhizium anisopliae BRIP 53284]